MRTVRTVFEIDIALQRGSFARAFRIATGPGLTTLTGVSGAGKTSILGAVAGIVRPVGGRIVVAGEVLFDSARRIDIAPERRRAGYIFQDARLFPHLRVRGNLRYGARRAGPGAIGVDEAVAFLGIEALLDRWPATLSGGEAQRVAIGRALISGPRFLLMDEPLAGLDGVRRNDVLTVVERVRDALGMPILYVSHDEAEVDRLASHRVDIASATV